MSEKLATLARRCTEAARTTEEWMLGHLAENAVLGSDLEDPVRYYKWPLALQRRGRRREALELLEWIAGRCLSEDGDFESARTGFHREFHSYANLWLIWAAARLGRGDLVEPTLGFVAGFHNPATGGLRTNPSDPEALCEDPLSTSFLGIVACVLGRRDLARACRRYLASLTDSQTSATRYWLRSLPDGSLVTEIPESAASGTFLIELGQQEQCYYFLGAMCYFLACHLEAFGTDEALEPAEHIAGLLELAGHEALSTIWAAKVAPGCVALYSATGRGRYLDLAWPVIDAVLARQSAGGYWLRAGEPWITVSAEQCYWLTDIAHRIEGNLGTHARAT